MSKNYKLTDTQLRAAVALGLAKLGEMTLQVAALGKLMASIGEAGIAADVGCADEYKALVLAGEVLDEVIPEIPPLVGFVGTHLVGEMMAELADITAKEAEEYLKTLLDAHCDCPECVAKQEQTATDPSPIWTLENNGSLN